MDLSADPLVGHSLAHYALLEAIGGGGMGRVYRARDERLQRQVAIKVLPEKALADPDLRARFEREALALARLSHPSIAAVYAFEHVGDLDVLVLEHVEGETLEARLAREPLAEGEAASLGVLIAGALEAAHARQVVHRDLKPANIMLTPRGEVKVLDFGLAKLLDEAGADAPAADISRGSLIVGTLSYMAPEQLLAAEVDARADLYALGVVLFRMATGRLPFHDQPAAALAGSVLNATPPSPRTLRPELSPRFEALVLRCLEKDPARRPASALELATELREVRDAALAGAANRGERIEAVAVLPLANLSGDPAEEYFADGMTDTLIARLAQIRSLRVISRTSAMQYKGTQRPLPEIARALRVGAIVEGSVLRSGGRVRVTAQLVDAASDCMLWAQSYEREVADVLALQNELARAIAEEVRARLTPEDHARLDRARAIDPRALEHQLRGRFLLERRTGPALERALEEFRAAVAADPHMAAAHTGIADAWNLIGVFRLRHPSQAFPHARDAAARALALDPDLAEAHTALAFASQHFDWDWPTAERLYRRAVALNPGYAAAHHWFADGLTARGRFGEGLREARIARDLDPLSAAVVSTVASVQYYARRYDEALELLREIVGLHPEFPNAHLDLGRVCEELGRLDEAEAAFHTAIALTGADPLASGPLGHLYARRGERDRALAVAERMLAAARERYISPYTIATIHAAIPDVDRALEWLERGFQERDPMMMFLRVHPRLDALRSDPRFDDLARRLEVTP